MPACTSRGVVWTWINVHGGIRGLIDGLASLLLRQAVPVDSTPCDSEDVLHGLLPHSQLQEHGHAASGLQSRSVL